LDFHFRLQKHKSKLGRRKIVAPEWKNGNMTYTQAHKFPSSFGVATTASGGAGRQQQQQRRGWKEGWMDATHMFA
jgi:hypothetical protein